MVGNPGLAAHPRMSGDALRISRQLEFARAEVRVHIRRAREAGQSWHAVGSLIGFGALASKEGVTVAEAAFDYAAGPRIFTGWWFDAPGFPWNCPERGRTVSDRGVCSGPRRTNRATAMAASGWPRRWPSGKLPARPTLASPTWNEGQCNDRTPALPRG